MTDDVFDLATVILAPHAEGESAAVFYVAGYEANLVSIGCNNYAPFRNLKRSEIVLSTEKDCQAYYIGMLVLNALIEANKND